MHTSEGCGLIFGGKKRKKMPFGGTLAKSVLCLFLCVVCNGAPPKDCFRRSLGTRYTDEEDAFIVNELLNMPGDYIPIHGSKIWEDMAEKLTDKWKQGISGFPQERTSVGVRNHFKDVLMCNHLNTPVKVPSSLLLKCGKPGSKRPYVPDEDDVIIQELTKTTSSALLSLRTVKKIHAILEEKRQAKIPGFDAERTIKGIREHLFKMRKNGKLPNNLLKKFKFLTDNEAAESSKTTFGNAETNLSTETIEEFDDAQINEMVDELLNNPDCFLDFTKLD